ncbi:MAG: hypothetical protein IPL12_09290 [Bacteroidetes bacterium]|nr:hypothetical protein [Bacteroidota bacterium]
MAAATPGCVTSFVPLQVQQICTNETLTWDIVPLLPVIKLLPEIMLQIIIMWQNNIDLAVALNYTNICPNPSTTYGWKVTPYNGYGEATGCPVNTFTTGSEVCYCIFHLFRRFMWFRRF